MDESFLAWPCGGLDGDGGRVADLTVECPALDDETDRPTTMAALLLTLAFGRKVGSAIMDEGGGGGGGLDLNGEWGREGGPEWTVITLLRFTLAVTLVGCELHDGNTAL